MEKRTRMKQEDFNPESCLQIKIKIEDITEKDNMHIENLEIPVHNDVNMFMRQNMNVGYSGVNQSQYTVDKHKIAVPMKAGNSLHKQKNTAVTKESLPKPPDLCSGCDTINSSHNLHNAGPGELSKIQGSFIDVEIKVEDASAELSEQQSETTQGSQDMNSETVLSEMQKVQQKVYRNGKINRIRCTKCDSTFKNRANMKQHLKYVHATEESMEDCKICYRTFKSKAHLRTHMSSVHVKEELVSCEFCQKTFINKKKLKNHIFYTHPQPSATADCVICNKTYKSAYSLKIHRKNVHPSEDELATCDVCNKSYKNDTLLQRHKIWSHPEDGMTYKCPECSRTLPSIQCYRKHIKNVHSYEEFDCDICNKTFKTRKILDRHVINAHSDTKPEPKVYKKGELKCSECPKWFSNNTSLTWHFERYHSENRRENSCGICSKVLSDYASVKRHIEMCHSLEVAKCHICEKVFKSHLNLQRHIKVTHAPPEEEKTCDICQKTFKCAMHLRIHVHSVHSTAGSFSCDLCGKDFSSKRYMVKHRKIHTATKDFPCLICGKFYKSVGEATKHRKRVHTQFKNVYNSTETIIGDAEQGISDSNSMSNDVDVSETEDG